MKSRYGFYKVASGLFREHVSDVDKNKEEMIALIAQAKKEDVQVLVFPELSLTGYTCQDLFFHPSLLEKSVVALEEIARFVPADLLVFVGLPLVVKNKIYNVAAALNDGLIKGFVPKTYIPNNSEYYEKRWFTSSNDLDTDVVLVGKKEVSIGSDLLFDFGDLIVGCEICEDLWVVKPPSDDMALAGANLIVNLSASDETTAKKDYRRDLVRMQSSKDMLAYLYCSCGEGESSQDLVFSGHQILYETGTPVFDVYDELGLHTGLIDVEKIQNDRRRDKSAFEPPLDKAFRIIPVGSDRRIDLLPSFVEPHPFLMKGEKRRLRSREILSLQARGLMTRLRNIRCSDVVLGISGGLDSTLALLVCAECFDRLKLDRKGIHAFSMPSKATSKTTFDNARTLCERIGCSYQEVPIKAMLEQHLKDIRHPEDHYDTTYENAQARIRTLILMDEANALGGIVVGTADLSEACLGFSTYNGDHMSMYAVNISVPKSLVRALIEDYALDHPETKDVLKGIVATPISPELIPDPEGKIVQKTESIIGSYDLHDFFLYHFLRNAFSKEKILALATIAFPEVDRADMEKTLDTFFRRFFTQQFKRSCLPDGVKVGSIAISPRGDLRMPSDVSAENTLNPVLPRKEGSR